MGRQQAKEFREVLCTGRWFASLPEEFQERLLDAARLRHLATGERLFARGDACADLYAVLEGSIRVSGTSADGKEALLVVLEPPNWFGEVAVFDEMARTHDAYADANATVAVIPISALRQVLDATPTYWRDLGRLVAGKLRLAFTTMEDTALLPISVRIARRLAWMADGYGEWQGPSLQRIEVRQDQLAQMLGCSRQTVNVNLKSLEAKGLIRTTYGQVEIADLAGLRAAAGL